MAIKDQPLSSLTWLSRDLLLPNAYNPNHVAAPELELLIISILEDGWTQPIVTLPKDENGNYQIVDGFHRWKVSDDPRIRKIRRGAGPNSSGEARSCPSPDEHDPPQPRTRNSCRRENG